MSTTHETNFRGWGIYRCPDWFLVAEPNDWDSTQIPFPSVDAAKAQIPLSKWTHILCTYSLGIPTASFYMNGAFMDTPTPTGTYTTVGTLDHCLCVGCSYLYSSPQDELVGNICEVIFENTQWSASKISRYYSYCTGKFVTK